MILKRIAPDAVQPEFVLQTDDVHRRKVHVLGGSPVTVRITLTDSPADFRTVSFGQGPASSRIREGGADSNARRREGCRPRVPRCWRLSASQSGVRIEREDQPYAA